MNNYFANISSQYTSIQEDDERKQPIPAPTSQPVTPIPVDPVSATIMGVADITKESIRCFTEYAKCKEHEKTERKRITAELKAIMYQIDVQKEVYLKSLELAYAERNRLYDSLEKAQEKALETGDKEMLMMCYNLILSIYNKPIQSMGGNNRLE